jgi:ribosomal protein S18 acetylase RimI-like enzyme
MRLPGRFAQRMRQCLEFSPESAQSIRFLRHAPIILSMLDFRIRDGRPADLAALCEIETRSFAADRLSRRSFRRLMGSPSARLRVAVMGDDIVGYHVVFRRAGSTVARLYSIAVAAAARGRGLGTRLLGDAERQAKRAGALVLRLEVRPDNAGAIRLYAERGFEPIGRHRDYYADGSDALRFQKTLPRAERRRAESGKDLGESDEDRSPPGSGPSPPVIELSRSAGAGCPAPAGGRAALPALQCEA